MKGDEFGIALQALV